MADDLDDGEFWLPQKFLTDDAEVSTSMESDSVTETDELESLSAFARSSIGVSDVQSKGWALSSSPKSTLCGCVAKDASSICSPNRPLSPPPAAVEISKDGATWNLLTEAAGEVARVKMRREKAVTSGTGFFDCSVSGQLRNPPLPKNNYSSFYTQPQFQPLSQIQPPRQGLVWGQVKAANGPLGLPPSAWPPLKAPPLHHAMSPTPTPAPASMFIGQQRECSGTGVFLPRQAPSPFETRNKPSGIGDGNGMMKGRSRKGERKSSRQSKTDNNQSEIQLPHEWTY